MATKAVLLDKGKLLDLRCVLCGATPAEQGRCNGVDAVGRRIGQSDCVFAVRLDSVSPR